MTFSTDLIDREIAVVRGFNDLDVDALTPGQLYDAAVAIGGARRALDALTVTVAGEVGRRSAPELGVAGLSKREGFSSPQEFLAKVFGTSSYEAKRLIDVGNALTREHEVALPPAVSDSDPVVDGVAGDGAALDPGAALDSGAALDPGAALDSGAALSPGGDGADPGLGNVEPGGGLPLDAPNCATAPKYPRLHSAVTSGQLGVEAAAAITRTLDILEPVIDSNARFAEGLESDFPGLSGGTRGTGGPGVAGGPDGSGGPVGADGTGAGIMSDAEHRGAMARARTSSRAELADLERRLVLKAQTLSVRELRRVCERERAWRSPKDMLARERRNVDGRTLFMSEDSDGMTIMTARMDAMTAAPIKAWIEAQTRRQFQLRRSNPKADGADVVDDSTASSDARGTGEQSAHANTDGLGGNADDANPYAGMTPEQRCRAHAVALADERSAGQIRIDALASLARHGLDCDSPTSGVKTTVNIRVDVKDLENDEAVAECDQLSTPISVRTMRAMAIDAQVIPVTMGGESLPLDVGRGDRYFTHAQRIALVERDGGCSWCHAPPSFCEAHHISWWARNYGRTDLSNGLLLCVSCHHRVHRDGWSIEVRDGEVMIQPSEIDGRPRPERIGGRAHLALPG